MPIYTGYLTQFPSSTSLSSHLTQTQNAVCIAVHNSLEHSLLGHETHPDPNHHGIYHLQAFDDTAHGDVYKTGDFRLFDGARGLYDDKSEEDSTKSSPEEHGNSSASEDNFDDLLDLENGSWKALSMHPDLPDLEVESEMANPLEQEVNLDIDETIDHQTHVALQQTEVNKHLLISTPAMQQATSYPLHLHPMQTSTMPNNFNTEHRMLVEIHTGHLFHTLIGRLLTGQKCMDQDQQQY